MSFHGTSFANQFLLTIARRKPVWLLGLLMLCASPVLAQVVFDGTQSTVPATGLSGPMGAAVDSSGNLYITDTTHNRIVKITPAGVPDSGEPVAVDGGFSPRPGLRRIGQLVC